MADIVYRNETVPMVRSRTDWGAIWAGVFTFVAIWSVFGLLGMAIFARVGNPAAAGDIAGMKLGMGIWSIVLTIVAMYVAGLQTGWLAAVANRIEGMIHGMAMFGLAVIATIVITVWGGATVSATTEGAVHNPYLLTVFSDIGWTGVIALFLGWLAAMGGAAQAASHKPEAGEVRDIRRPAA